MKYEHTEHFAVAMNPKNGMFLGFNESPSTTSPFSVYHPNDAKKVWPHNGSEPLKPAPYYFENSGRMRDWLKGFKMVWVTQKIIAEIEDAS